GIELPLRDLQGGGAVSREYSHLSFKLHHGERNKQERLDQSPGKGNSEGCASQSYFPSAARTSMPSRKSCSPGNPIRSPSFNPVTTSYFVALATPTEISRR